MVNLKIYLVSVDKCDYQVVQNLTKDERQKVYCYAVNASVPKLFTAPLKRINEWELAWHDNRYQVLQYYEYGAIVHCIKNLELIEGLTHIGLLHYDVLFKKNSVNNLITKLDETSDKIFYIMYRQNDVLYFTKEQLKYIADYLSPKLNVNIDVDKVWNEGWISEALSVTPISIFKNFGEFLLKYQYDIEDILNKNRWGLMNTVKHRLCGFTERLWGIYLVSCGMSLEKLEIEHDWDAYQHKHLVDKENYLKKIKK
jgi:hypothetical protein